MKEMTVGAFKRKYGICISQPQNKMHGIHCLGTSRQMNPNCKARMGCEGTVCAKCYVGRIETQYKDRFTRAMIRNTQVLTGTLIPYEDIPVFPQNGKWKKFRFEPYADLINDVQAKNYLNLCYKNPGTSFAIWTKNPWILESVFNEGYKKPKNLQILQSSVRLNEEDKPYDSWVDKTFTVYTDDFIKEKGISINCGAKDCDGCGTCYRPSIVKSVREKLK